MIQKTRRQFNRRQFLRTTSAVAACTGAMGPLAAANAVPLAPPQVELGRTGITLSRVGQGTGMHGGRRQSDHTRMGFEKLVALLRHAYERGITFFDLADLYGTHVYLREALRFFPREKITILSKLWWRYDGPTKPKAEPYRKKVAATTIERFLHEIATDHIDILLLHCATTSTWQEELEPYMAAMDEAKKQGKLRAVGVSCHHIDALRVAAESSWVDVILARINPDGVKMDGTPDQVTAVLRRAKQNGKAVIGMKILGEGQLADQKHKCIQFAQELGLLDAMTIGFEQPKETDEILGLISRYPAQPVVTGG
ncbi:MAG TPA: aldo/keto reductase [Planctomycetaceae bacterium]|nr:aldo/keto reductase [Planctomycetaceae bacterium]